MIGRRGGTEINVRLTDQSDEPLSGIMVMFTLPEQGAGDSFTDGSKRLIVHTSEAGEAIARGFSPNTVLGDSRSPSSCRGNAPLSRLHLRRSRSSDPEPRNFIQIFSDGQLPSAFRLCFLFNCCTESSAAARMDDPQASPRGHAKPRR